MNDIDDHMVDDDDECPNCGGEGFFYSCEEEFACIDPESGCDLCRRRCDWCRPVRHAQTSICFDLTADITPEENELALTVLADALRDQAKCEELLARDDVKALFERGVLSWSEE